MSGLDSGDRAHRAEHLVGQATLRCTRIGTQYLVDEADLDALMAGEGSTPMPDWMRLRPDGRPQPDWTRLVRDARRSHYAVAALRLVVLDTSVVLPSCLAGGLRFPGWWHWLAPTLLWSEVLSTLHEATWRGDLTGDEATAARTVFASLPIHREDVAEIADEAWRVADELGLAKTYDAEFLALARLRGALLVTADARLRRGADRLGFVVDPVEFEQLAELPR